MRWPWLLALAVLVVQACAPMPRAPAPSTAPPSRPAPPGGFPRSAEQASGPAVLALLREAESARGSGQTQQASGALERARRIEPRNAFVWQALAETRLAEQLPEQAETMAHKSNSLAQGNPYLEAENWRLIAEARRARGDAYGADEAERKAQALQALLED